MRQYLRNLPIDIFIYPEHEGTFVEHLSPEEMKKWLRTEPTSLPFVEVWEDLIQLLAVKNSFQTVARNSPFIAHIAKSSAGIEIRASGQRYLIEYERLMAFWQQLRTHGFSTRQIAPGIDREISYLIPIFAELDYISPVYVAEDYTNLSSGPVIGLQVLPSAFARNPQSHLTQLSLPIPEWQS